MINTKLKSPFLYIALLMLICVISLSFSCESSSTAEESRPYVAADAYEYPIKPGTPAWAELQSHAERVAACQIPEEILKNMSTAGLVETVERYTFWGDMLAFSTRQVWIDNVTSHCNGWQELINRQDAAEELLARSQVADRSFVIDAMMEQYDYLTQPDQTT